MEDLQKQLEAMELESVRPLHAVFKILSNEELNIMCNTKFVSHKDNVYTFTTRFNDKYLDTFYRIIEEINDEYPVSIYYQKIGHVGHHCNNLFLMSIKY
jgi:hypothetical protein